MPKQPKMCRYSSFSSSHFLFSRDFSGTIADTDIINTLPERFGTQMCLLGVTNPKLKIYEKFLAANQFLTVVVPSSE